MPQSPHTPQSAPLSRFTAWVSLLALTAGLSALTGAGCALNVNLNANRLESPEATGELLHGSIDAGLTGSNTLIVASPGVSGAPVTTGWDRSNASARLSGNMGLFDRLDMGVKTSWNGPVILQAKYQFLGAPELRARSGNVSMAVTFGAGVTEPSGDSTVAGSGTTSHTNLTLTTYDIAWIAGVRVAETWMIYGGGFLGSTSFSGTINQSGAAVGALPVQGSTTEAGGNLGLQLDSVLGALKIEEAWVYASVGGITQPGFYTGACLSYRF